ncbi:MAG: type IV pilus modification PilV family protein [Solirubrobacteraceae bacterium]
MIDTNLLRRWRAPTGQLSRIRARCGGPGTEEGFTLIEVIVSALLVGFIAIATFNGFDVANRTTADQRHHDQAVVLAAQSQELLRSDSAATLDPLEHTAHAYTQTLGGEKYTVVESDKWINDANPNATCSAVSKEHSSHAGNYLEIVTEVSWPQLLAAGRKPLKQSSLITPPDGSGLEVDVVNGRIPLQPVAGVTVRAGEAEAATGEAGCVIFGGIPATRITVEAFKPGDVTPTGAIKKVAPEYLITPNITTRLEAVLNQGAAITAAFTHEGKPVTGDTFVALNSKLEPAPSFEVGSTRFNAAYGKEGEYEALPGTGGPESYKEKATTPKNATYYPTGDLFPYENPWSVYAGDCPANNPHTVDSSEYSEASVSVPALEPGQNAEVKVPTSEVKLTAYKGTKSVPIEHETLSQAVKITNTECASLPSPPNNALHLKAEHTQSTTSEGKLEAPFQPFGKSFKLCLYDEAKHTTYTTTYADETTAGPTIGIYLKEPAGPYADGNGHTVTVKTLQASNTC